MVSNPCLILPCMLMRPPYLPLYDNLFCTGIIKAKVLNPIPTEGKTTKDVSDLTENVRQAMLKVFHEHDPSGSEKDASSTDTKKIK